MYLNNSLGRIYLLSFADAIGRAALDKVLIELNMADLIRIYRPRNPKTRNTIQVPFYAFASIADKTLRMYNDEAGPVIVRRAGYAGFEFLSNETRPLHDALSFARTINNQFIRNKVTLNAIARTIDLYTNQQTSVEQIGSDLIYHVGHCPFCEGYQHANTWCYWLQGLITRGISFTEHDTPYTMPDIPEIYCRARGDQTCSFTIQMTLSPAQSSCPSL
jgi:hypothetical protein